MLKEVPLLECLDVGIVNRRIANTSAKTRTKYWSEVIACNADVSIPSIHDRCLRSHPSYLTSIVELQEVIRTLMLC